MRKLGKWALGGIGILVLLAAILFIWSITPLAIDRTTEDPGVAYLNKTVDGDGAYSESYFTYQGQTLHYVESGDGEAILFVHGFPSTWLSFIRQMDAFKGTHRVIAIDGLGAGRSDAPRAEQFYKLEAMTQHVSTLMDHLGITKAHLVGHDWGSAFVLGFAQRYPEKVITVTGLSAPPQNVMLKLIRDEAEEREVFAYIEQLKRANPILLALFGVEQRIWEGAYGPLVAEAKLTEDEGRLFRHATSNLKRIDRHINWYRANIPAPDKIETDDFWPTASARISMPAQFIWGTEDWIITDRAVEELNNMSDDLTRLPIPGAGHWPHIEEAERITNAIRRLIKSGSAVP